jgi:hypothetical protein
VFAVVDNPNCLQNSGPIQRDYYFIAIFKTRYSGFHELLLEPSGCRRGEYKRSGFLCVTEEGTTWMMERTFAQQEIESIRYEEMDENRNYTIKII